MAELTATIDMTEKTGENLVRAENVVIEADGKNWVYFMTNDYATICGVLGSSGCRPPLAEDLEPDPQPDKKLSDKMKELGATWALPDNFLTGKLSYYDKAAKAFFTVQIYHIPMVKGSPFYPFYFFFAKNNLGKGFLDDLIDNVDKTGDVNPRNATGETPLIVAAEHNSCDALKLLIDHGADVNATANDGSTALLQAVIRNNKQAVRLLLSVPGIDLEIKSPDEKMLGHTALHFAAELGFSDVASMLVGAGADVNASALFGVTPLMLAVKNGFKKITGLLIRSGADVDKADSVGRTAISIAVHDGNTPLIAMLLDAGADLRILDDLASIFHEAVFMGKEDVINLFLDRKLFTEEDLKKAIPLAAMQGFADLTDRMIRLYGDSREAARLALGCACVKNRADIVKLCCGYECRLNDPDPGDFGMTPLMLACYCGSKDAVRVLVSCGADVNAADDDGMTALMYAASKHDADTVIFLINNGADKTARSAEGKDYKDYGDKYDSRDISQMLEDKVKAHTPGLSAGTEAVTAEPKSFGETFDLYLKKYFRRFPDRKNSDIYRGAGLSKQRFSKILSNRDPDYHPRKENVIALALGLRLTLAESEDLLQSAGFILSPKDTADMLAKDFLSAGKHDIHELNGLIYEATGKAFFKSLTAGEEE